MKHPFIVIVTAALLAVVPNLASAQSAKAEVVPITAQADNQIRASDLIGLDVYNDANEVIGWLNGFILEDKTAKIYVIASGGFLGVGEKLVGLPESLFKLSGKPTDPKGLRLSLTKPELKALPEFRWKKKE